ncbi:MAG: hypothetical protein ACP5SH_07705 [Syntrophobacteraceae bacterium]
MKKWRRYLRVVWRFARIMLAVIMTLFLCVVLMGQIAMDGTAFEAHMSRTVTPERGNIRAIYISESRILEGLGGGDDYRDMIVLRRRDGRGPVTRIFVYEPTYENKYYEPRIRWINSDHLEIYLDKVDHIYSRKMKALGITITYCIGHITNP